MSRRHVSNDSVGKTYYSEPQLADFLGVSVFTLRAWRRRCAGPPVTQLAGRNSRILYRRTSVDEWLAAAEHKPTRRIPAENSATK